MKNKYLDPIIEIIKFEYDLKMNSGSIVINYPWQDEENEDVHE